MALTLFFCVLLLKAAVLVALRSRITSYGTHTRQGEIPGPLIIVKTIKKVSAEYTRTVLGG